MRSTRTLLHAVARRVAPLAMLALLALATGCIRFGPLGMGLGKTLTSDARTLSPGDAAGPGPKAVTAVGVDIGRLAIALYRPVHMKKAAPAIVFLPGLMAPERQYESYARGLASRGFVVAVRAGYGPFTDASDLKGDASYIADWLVKKGLADETHLGVAGHSRGAKGAVWAAAADNRFKAVVALEPDDHGTVSVVHGPLAKLTSPLMLIGAEVAWKGWQICSPREHNYQRFFERAPAGTVEITLHDADHVQVMDDPDFPGQSICRVGTADSLTVRTLARRALVSFFEQHLGHAPPSDYKMGAAGSVRVKPADPVKVAAK